MVPKEKDDFYVDALLLSEIEVRMKEKNGTRGQSAGFS